jgi:hypothetical protein
MHVLVQGGYLERKQKRQPYFDSTSISDSGSSNSPWLQLLTSAAVNATAAYTSAATAAATADYSSSAGLTDMVDGGGFGNFSDVIHTNLDLLTLSNVYPGSKRMWVHLASVYVITLVALKVSLDRLHAVPFADGLNRVSASCCAACTHVGTPHLSVRHHTGGTQNEPACCCLCRLFQHSQC